MRAAAAQSRRALLAPGPLPPVPDEHSNHPLSGNASDTGSRSMRANKLDLVERLADDLAHEIKNPLHSMVINLEVLKRRIARPGGSEPDELMRYAGVLGSELDRVSRRVELLLRMVRRDRGAEPITLHAAVEELLELLELEQERRSVRLRFEPDPTPVRATLPADLARQIVLNLLLSSLDSVAPGGELLLRTEADEQWSRLRLEVLPGAGEDDPGEAPDAPVPHDGLEVARSLSEQLGGRVEAAGDSVSAGAVVLWLPLDPATE